jgi:hypothetical protein
MDTLPPDPAADQSHPSNGAALPPTPLSSDQSPASPPPEDQRRAVLQAVAARAAEAARSLAFALSEPVTEPDPVQDRLLQTNAWLLHTAAMVLESQLLPAERRAAAFRAELDAITRRCWQDHPAKRPRAAEVGLRMCPPQPQTYDYDAHQLAEAARQQLGRLLKSYLHITWREYIRTVRPP